ncbi:MAG: hypothetical protein AAGD25_02590 [Cyanobacteria bacterium P01_F01_bin.150]
MRYHHYPGAQTPAGYSSGDSGSAALPEPESQAGFPARHWEGERAIAIVDTSGVNLLTTPRNSGPE